MTLVELARIPAVAVDPDAVLVIPFGAHEQHGPHLPHATDAILVEAVAHAAAHRAEALAAVTPTLPFGVSAHHLGLGATLSVRASTFLELVADLVATASVGGFRRVLLLNGHGGNAGLLAATANEIVAKGELVCASASYWDLAAAQIAELRLSDRGGMSHACELETALMLHLAPELVDREAIPETNLGREEPLLVDDMIEPAPLALGIRMRDEVPLGVLGAPKLATDEHGARLFDAIVTAAAAAIDTIAGRALPGVDPS